MRPLHKHHDDRERRVYEHGEKAEEPYEDRAPISDALGEKVPGRVEGGRRQYQDQREEGYRIRLLSPRPRAEGSIALLGNRFAEAWGSGLLLNWRA